MSSLDWLKGHVTTAPELVCTEVQAIDDAQVLMPHYAKLSYMTALGTGIHYQTDKIGGVVASLWKNVAGHRTVLMRLAHTSPHVNWLGWTL